MQAVETNANDVLSAHILRQIGNASGVDTRPGKRTRARIEARCNLAEAGHFIREGVSEIEVHVDDIATLKSLVEDGVSADHYFSRRQVSRDGERKAHVSERVAIEPFRFTEADVKRKMQELEIERSRTLDGGEVTRAEAFFALSHRSERPIIKLDVLDGSESEPAKAKKA
jgi:hypothetical protein